MSWSLIVGKKKKKTLDQIVKEVEVQYSCITILFYFFRKGGGGYLSSLMVLVCFSQVRNLNSAVIAWAC